MNIGSELVLVPTVGLSREEWLAERMKGIGGSDAGAVLGVNPWRTAVDVWLEKTGRKAGFEGNAATYWGSKLEDLVAQEYADQKAVKVRRHNYLTRVGFLLGDVDRLVWDGITFPAVNGIVRADRILEAKTAKSVAVWGGEVPAYVIAQVMHYMALFPSVEVVDVACLFLAERDFQVFPVERDADVIAAMVEQLTEWWQKHVVEGVPPEPANEADCRALWARHRPGVTVTATSEVEQAVATLAEVKAAIADLESRESAARAEVLKAIGDAEVLVDALGRPLATWKANKDSEVTDWKAVALAAGATDDLVKKFTTVRAGARVLRPKAVREGSKQEAA